MNLFKQTWKAYWKNKKEIPIAVISDILFYYFLALLSGYSMKRMLAVAEQIVSAAGSLTSTAAVQGTKAIPQYKELNKIMWLLFAGILLIWIAFKGISWWQAHKALGEQISPKEFVKKFALASICFYAITLVLAFLVTYAQYKLYYTQASGAGTAGIISLILLLVILYFGTVSYSAIGRSNPIKEALAIGIKEWKQTILPFAVSTAAFIASGLLFYFLMIQNIYVAIGAAMLIILPAIHYFRLLMINAIKRANP